MIPFLLKHSKIFFNTTPAPSITGTQIDYSYNERNILSMDTQAKHEILRNIRHE